MKKVYGLILIFILSFVLVGCGSKTDDGLTLRIYNWQDYMDEGLDDEGMKIGPSVMEEWQAWYKDTYGKDVKIVYHTFETNEVMMNNLKTGKTSYDLICPSEYTIQKMMNLDMVEPFDYDLKDANGNLVMENYKYVSPYLKKLFNSKGWDKYAVPFMWGTMGFIYNPEKVDNEAIKNWSILWDKNYKNKATAKDSVRDTYVVGVMHVYYDELMELKSQYEKGEITGFEYNTKLGAIMNRCDDETLKKVEAALKEMKKNLYGFEVDSGKSDIVTGKVAINFAWSGDSVFSMDVAEEENGVYLNYQIPEEGSNVWFDGWVMPKGANKELAESFVNYLCKPEIAARNMNYIGYTSSVVGDDILDLIDDWYGAIMPEFDDKTNTWHYDEVDLKITDESLEPKVVNHEIYLGTNTVKDILANIKDEDGNPYSETYKCTSYESDLTYLFEGAVSSEYVNSEGKIMVTVEEKGRQFDAQFPDYETIQRCGIMEDFGDQNENVLAMWENVKIGDIPFSLTIILIVVVVGIIVAINVNKYVKVRRRRQRKNEA